MKQLGINIKIARIRKGISQKDFAVNIGKSANWLCLIESGKRIPSLKVLYKIAIELETSMSDLFKEV